MARLRLKYVYEDVDRHGNVRVYFWRGRGHRKVRCREAIGTPGFQIAYEEFLGSKVSPAPEARKGGILHGSFRWLSVRYLESPEFRQLEGSTRYARRRIIDAILLEPVRPDAELLFADIRVEQFSAKGVRVLRDRKASTPDAANARLLVIRQMFAWAQKYEIHGVRTNPAQGIEKLRKAPGGIHTWSDEEIAQFEATHPIGTRPRLAMALMLYTGQRRSDIIAMGRQHVRNGMLTITQQKNRNRRPVTLSIPMHADLVAIIEATPSGHLTFLTTASGKQFTSNSFGSWFREKCNLAGLPQCSAHGLRKAAATRLAERGATERQIMAITGHRTSQQVDLYTKAARQKVLAVEAMALFGGTDTEQPVSHPDVAVGKNAKK